MKFDVTYETITAENAEHGDFEDLGLFRLTFYVEASGFISQDVSLREALEDINGYGCHVEADCYPVGFSDQGGSIPRWFTFYQTNEGTREFFETGTTENRALHMPDNISPHSVMRIARLINCYGITS